MKKYLPLLLVLFVPYFILAQQVQDGHSCGTRFVGATPFDKAVNAMTDFSKAKTTLYIPVTANFIGDDNGNGYYQLYRFLDNLCQLNIDFEEHGFLFYLENIKYINSSEFYIMDLDTFVFKEPMFQFVENNNTVNTLNAYIVKQAGGWSFLTLNEAEDFDYTVVPCEWIFKESHAVVLDMDHLSNASHLISHEVGHYFGLEHTFWGSDWSEFEVNGTPDTFYYDVYFPALDDTLSFPWLVERVDGVNCDISGDRICDTSPNYLGNFVCNANQESDIVQTDPVGATFRSDGTNYMSYSNDACQDQFSPMQVDLMRSVAEGPRSFLLYDQTVPQELSVDDLAMIYPPDGETVAVYSDSLTLTWDMPGADFYLLTYGRKANNLFLPIKSNILLTENEYQFKVSYFDKDHYWIVRGVSKYFPCEVWADTSCFTPTEFVYTNESKQAELLELYPNPTSNLLYLHFTENAPAVNPLDAEILDVQGRSFGRMAVAERKVDVSALPAGFYFLKLTDGNQVYVGKFIKQ